MDRPRTTPILKGLTSDQVQQYLDDFKIAQKNDDSLSLRDGIPDTILEGIYLLKPLADPDSEEDPHEGFVSAEEELKGFFESRQAIPSFRSLVSSLANLRPDFKERDTEARYLAFAAKFQRLRKRASHLNLDLPWWMNQFAEKVRPTRIAEDFVERIKAGSIPSMTILLQEVIDECSAFERLDGYRTPNKPSSRNHHSTQSLTTSGTPKALTKLTDKERTELSRSGSCFRCRQKGHVAAMCPLAVKKRNKRY
ncbi:hypothetical protein GEMRC1_008076 [Eukaryota sp. GEM-RC1]